MNQIHGHEVINMMLASGRTYTKDSLVEEIITQFGADTRFQTCAADGLTAEGLVDFLEARGKFVAQEGGFQISEDLKCQS